MAWGMANAPPPRNAVADGPHSAILRQVTNGLAVRMAVLYLVSGAKGGVE